MKAVYEKKEHNQGVLKVTVQGQQWTDALAKAFKKIAKNVEIKGFRKGSAPESMVRKHVSEAEIRMRAVEEVAQDAFTFGLDENKDVKLVAQPALDIESVTDTEATLVFNLTVYPEIKVGDYSKIEYKEKKVSVTKKDVDDAINQLRERNSEEVLKEDGKVCDGDIAVIDFEGFKDGVAFEGGKGTEYPLEIGSGSFIPGFEEQVIGMEVNEEKDINVTFPENYGAPELAGKAVVFHVKVDAIKIKQLPELNDEFVAEQKINDVKTVDDLTKYYKEQIKEEKKQQAEEEATNDLLDELDKITEVEIPEAMIQEEIKNTLETYAARLSQQGINMDMYYQLTGSSEEMMKEQLHPECEKKVKVRLSLEGVAKAMNLEVTEEEFNEEIEAMAKQYNMEVEKVKELVPTDYLTEDLKIRKALDKLKKQTKAA